MENNVNLRYQFSRVPEITTATFQTRPDDKEPDLIKSRDQLEEELKLWYMMFMDKIRGGGHISVAELRRKAGLDISLKDYLFGFDEDCLAYTGNHGLELIKFHPIHLKQIVDFNTSLIDFSMYEGEDIILEYQEIETEIAISQVGLMLEGAV